MDCHMVLIVGLPIAEDGVTRELNVEFGSMVSGLGNEFAVTINKRGEDPWITFLSQWFLLEISNLEIRVGS